MATLAHSLGAMSTRQLRQECVARGVDLTQCLDRQSMLEKLQATLNVGDGAAEAAPVMLDAKSYGSGSGENATPE
eukprot:2959627-Amphidinium_carterae.1